MGITCNRCGRLMDDWWEIEDMPGVGGNCTCCGDDLCAKCAGGWNEDGECKECQKEEYMNVESRFEAIERRLAALEAVVGLNSKKYPPVLDLGLLLPEDTIDGLHFNETKVHAVFEKQNNGWYYSRDILFLSARNTIDDTSRDILTEYLNRPHDNGLKEQLAGYFGVKTGKTGMIAVSLPHENEGIKQYNGVKCEYWLSDEYSGSSTAFGLVNIRGVSSTEFASAMCGCSPIFRVAG